MKTNLNRFGLFAILLVVGFASTPVLAQASLKIGVVDMEQVLLSCNMGKELQTQLEAFQKEVEAQGIPMAEKIQAMQKDLNEKAASLSQAKISDMRRQIEDQKISIQRFQTDKQEEFERRKNTGLQEIEKKLKPVMESLREKDGFDMILHKPGVVIIAKEQFNITQLVIDRMNAAK